MAKQKTAKQQTQSKKTATKNQQAPKIAKGKPFPRTQERNPKTGEVHTIVTGHAGVRRSIKVSEMGAETVGEAFGTGPMVALPIGSQPDEGD